MARTWFRWVRPGVVECRLPAGHPLSEERESVSITQFNVYSDFPGHVWVHRGEHGERRERLIANGEYVLSTRAHLLSDLRAWHRQRMRRRRS